MLCNKIINRRNRLIINRFLFEKHGHLSIFSIYPAIILLSVAACGFEFPIVLPTRIEREDEGSER